MDSCMLKIGAEKEAIVEARKSVLEIISCKEADQSLRMKALEVFVGICEAKNTTITGCTFTSKK